MEKSHDPVREQLSQQQKVVGSLSQHLHLLEELLSSPDRDRATTKFVKEEVREEFNQLIDEFYRIEQMGHYLLTHEEKAIASQGWLNPIQQLHDQLCALRKGLLPHLLTQEERGSLPKQPSSVVDGLEADLDQLLSPAQADQPEGDASPAGSHWLEENQFAQVADEQLPDLFQQLVEERAVDQLEALCSYLIEQKKEGHLIERCLKDILEKRAEELGIDRKRHLQLLSQWIHPLICQLSPQKRSRRLDELCAHQLHEEDYAGAQATIESLADSLLQWPERGEREPHLFLQQALQTIEALCSSGQGELAQLLLAKIEDSSTTHPLLAKEQLLWGFAFALARGFAHYGAKAPFRAMWKRLKGGTSWHPQLLFTSLMAGRHNNEARMELLDEFLQEEGSLIAQPLWDQALASTLSFGSPSLFNPVVALHLLRHHGDKVNPQKMDELLTFCGLEAELLFSDPSFQGRALIEAMLPWIDSVQLATLEKAISRIGPHDKATARLLEEQLVRCRREKKR